MTAPRGSDVTALLEAVRQGDRTALRQLFPLVYDELLRIARGQRRRQAATDTLNTTALVHEAFIKLLGSESHDFQDRAHFLAVAATAMRQILIGHARRRAAAKRGNSGRRVPLADIEFALASEPGLGDVKSDLLLAIDEALTQLARHSERQSRVVECRIFGGLSIEETAAALGVSRATVNRDWSMALAWLYRQLQRDVE